MGLVDVEHHLLGSLLKGAVWRTKASVTCAHIGTGSVCYFSVIKCSFVLTNASEGATCTVCSVLHGWSREQKNEQQHNAPSPKKPCTAGYQGPVKIEILKGAGLLLQRRTACTNSDYRTCLCILGHYYVY